MRSSVKSSSLIVFAILTIFTVTSLAQSSTNEGRKRGARGGALLGLTMGVVAGDAGLAAAGAVVGGVAVGGQVGPHVGRGEVLARALVQPQSLPRLPQSARKPIGVIQMNLCERVSRSSL